MEQEQLKNRTNIIMLRDTPCLICGSEVMMKVQSFLIGATTNKVICTEGYTYFACPNCCNENDKLEEIDKAAWKQAQHTRHIKPLRELFMGINSNYRTLLLAKGEKMSQ